MYCAPLKGSLRFVTERALFAIRHRKIPKSFVTKRSLVICHQKIPSLVTRRPHGHSEVPDGTRALLSYSSDPAPG